MKTARTPLVPGLTLAAVAVLGAPGIVLGTPGPSFGAPGTAAANHGAGVRVATFAVQAPLPSPDPAAAADSYETWERALELFESGRFEEAEPLLAELAERRGGDGELWYGLGRAREATGDAPGAIAAYRAALEHGFRFEASVAYRIAALHAASRPDSAIAWLRRALDMRLGDRPGVADDSAFAPLRGDPRFADLLPPSDVGLSRDEMWRRDIDYLVEEARRLHVGPHRPAYSAPFDDAAQELKARVPELSDDRVAIEIGRLMNLLEDGHTGLYGVARPGSPMDVDAGSLPLLFYRFTDGIFVVDAAEGFRDRIGAEVLAFGDVSADSALVALGSYMHGDNAMTATWLGVRFMLPGFAFLRAIGAAEGSRAMLTLRGADGEERVVFEAGDYLQDFRRKLRPPPGGTPQPLYLQNVDVNYWVRPLPEHDALYFQFNQVRDAEEGPSIAEYSDSLRAALESSGARHLIVDVRHNNGGNNGLLRPLLRVLTWWEVDDEEHVLWVIAGRNTFSAAQNFLNRLERATDAVFVGEPSSSRPNFTGESTNLVLPYSGLIGSISNRYWQDSDPDDARSFIPPRVPVGLSSEDYFAGRDPAMEAILLVIERARGT